MERTSGNNRGGAQSSVFDKLSKNPVKQRLVREWDVLFKLLASSYESRNEEPISLNITRSKVSPLALRLGPTQTFDIPYGSIDQLFLRAKNPEPLGDRWDGGLGKS